MLRPCTTKSIRNRSLQERRPRTYWKSQAVQEQVVVQKFLRLHRLSIHLLICEMLRIHRRHSIRSSTSTSSGVLARHMRDRLLLPPVTFLFLRVWTTNRFLVTKHKSTQCVHMLKTKKEVLDGTRSRLLLSSYASLVQSPPVTGACCKIRLMSTMPLSCMRVEIFRLFVRLSLNSLTSL